MSTTLESVLFTYAGVADGASSLSLSRWRQGDDLRLDEEATTKSIHIYIYLYILYYTMLCYAMLCYAMLCDAMLCYAILYMRLYYT